ncbi:MAG: UDP-N-acetylmuramoyl-L-alanine--D-glutamate ligase, partial [Saprospiraceae bacterium]|nr:UDP-N-acetylmuramoyl-L-alanine--D-glutamate ligase [Saprospiraceae bacterium]
LDDIEYFRPRIAMLLNITPDHLDRYEGSLEKYARAKFRITMNQRRGDVFIFNAADPVISEILGTVEYKNSKPKHVAIRKGFYKNGRIAVGKLSFDMTKSRLKGPHNMFNAVCAVRAAVLLGADAE